MLDDDDDNDEQIHATQASSHNWIPAQPGQRYTFRDMFCGAGGTSCGAQQAGFRVLLGCDADNSACTTYRLNYPEARLIQGNVADVITSPVSRRVDVLHLSPPCQFFSPAHTREGQNDEANTAALFACSDLVNKIRPRIFTLEQTFGITFADHESYMNSLVRGFTMYGYSVRWSVIQLLTWGTSTQRKRLIIIGSCPGEPLPTFPAPTHAERPARGQKPYMTVFQALSRGRPLPGDIHHQPGRMRRVNRASWNAHQFLPRTITTSGVDAKFCHPSGTRGFTPREIANLQGFPPRYKFSPTQVQKQAGNAFPPPAVKTLYDHLRKWLLKVDRVQQSLPASAHSTAATAISTSSEPGFRLRTRSSANTVTTRRLPTILIIDEEDSGNEDLMAGCNSGSNSSGDDDDDDIVMLDSEPVFTPSGSRESTATLPEFDLESGGESVTQHGAYEQNVTEGVVELVKATESDEVVEISSWRVVGRHATRLSWNLH
ncbi:S-adenosyl-L-methionine-dependent methyltransferase [Microdochium bolleyi]|uniref:DNA (cytosine-5-)-methyltransferase n=1 Tax=Microdochium bolleyi TaxID=196109 RepID=A0A136IR37_9PEZI|nr:S-adenosyl-L-methionine-dependent methyltransferase [Microdochium bolleyi]